MKENIFDNLDVEKIENLIPSLNSDLLEKISDEFFTCTDAAALVTDISSDSGFSKTLLQKIACCEKNGVPGFELTLFAPVKFNNLEQLPNRKIMLSIPVLPVETNDSVEEIEFVVSVEFLSFTEDENHLRSAVFTVVGFDKNTLSGLLSFLNVIISRENLKNNSGI